MTPAPPCRAGAAAFALALAGAVVLLVAACSGRDAPSASTPAPPRPTPTTTAPVDVPGAGGAPSPAPLGWTSCGSAECATLPVPLDHLDPTGPTVEIAVARRPASDPDRRLGVLLVNPGGPGASGTAMVGSAALGELGERFDLVGWDPRGVGDSTPLACGDDIGELWEADAADPSARPGLDDVARRMASACQAEAGDLLDHLGTVVAARDLDLVRQALGEEAISYLGFSYGTLLGQEYARLHPERVRAMVLDGVVDPTEDLAEMLRGQAVAMEATLGDLTEAYDDVVAAARARPLPVDGGSSAGPGVVALAAVAASYGEAGHRALADALDEAEDGDGTGLAELARSYGSGGVSFGAYLGVTCADSPRPEGPEAWWAMADAIAREAPRMGHAIATELLACAFWPAAPDRPLAPVAPSGLAPVLVVGGTGDAATPYDDAEAVAGHLPGAVLLTADQPGHTAVLSSRCVHDEVLRYLVDLALPAPGTVCPG